jgi:hypothetical protein
MNRRLFIKDSALAGAMMLGPGFPGLSALPGKEIKTVSDPLMGNRFVTLCIMIRTTPWEVSRDVKLIDEDESEYHTLEVVRTLREAFAKNNPDGRLTWGFTLNALEDKRQNYIDIRKYTVECHQKYGDEITYFPGYFPALYLPRARVNSEISQAFSEITDIVGAGYRPQSIIGGFLSADNMRHLSEKENIHVAHGVIWSQHAVDGGGADGSPSYPYYPSKEHFCKPAQGSYDFIDCVNLDGWSVDFHCARISGGIQGTTVFNSASSRRGVGPIETYCDWGLDIGHLSVMHTQSIHFDRGLELNGFGWIPNIWEAALVKRPERKDWGESFIPAAMTKWVTDTVKRWPDVKFVTFGEFGELWRKHYRSNTWNYRFEERGLGIGNSWGNEDIRWFMNRSFRLAMVRNWQLNTPELVIDFTRYDLPAHEPADPSPDNPIKDWSLMNRINQKGLRKQDRPIPLADLGNDDKNLIAKYYPELIK